MAGNGKALATRFPDYFLFFLLFVALPALYLDGIHQPESSLKMPLLAVFVSFLVIFIWMLPVNRFRNEAFAFLRRRKFIIIFLLLLAWMGILVNKSVNPADALVEVARWLLLFLFLVTLTAYLFGEPRRRQFFLAGPSVAVLVWSVYGIIQLVQGFLASRNTGVPFRIDFSLGSTLGNKNSFAEVLLLCLPFSLYGWMTAKGKAKALHATAGVTAVLFLFLLKSLATWVAAGTGLLFYLLLTNPRFAGYFNFRNAARFLLFVVIVFSAVMVFQRNFQVDSISRKMQLIPGYLQDEQLFKRNSPANNNSIYERLLLWRDTFKMIEENPVTGVGTGNWKIFLYKYGIIGTDFISTGLVHYEHPHNDYLLMLAECGAVGLLLMAFLVYFLFREGLEIRKKQADPLPRTLASLMLTEILLFLVLSLFGYPWFKVVAPVLLLLSVAVLFSMGQMAGDGQPPRAKPAPALFYLFTLLACGFVFFIGTQRLKGEARMFAVQDAKYKKDWPRILRILKADLPFFRIDAEATPLDWHRGIACYYSGNLVAAKEFFLKAESQHPYHMQLLNDLGSISEMEGDHEKALNYYSRALQVSPLNIPARLNKTAVFFNTKQADSAFVTLDPVYGNRLTGQDRQRYEKTISLVLYAKAYTLVRQLEVSVQPGLFNQISDRRMLRRVYIESKKNNRSFGEQLLNSIGREKSPE